MQSPQEETQPELYVTEPEMPMKYIIIVDNASMTHKKSTMVKGSI